MFVSPDKVAIEVIKLIKKYPDINIWWDWLPLCLFKWYEDKISNLQTENIMYMSETYENEIFNTDYGIREYSKKCKWCKLKESCSSNFKVYNNLYWEMKTIGVVLTHQQRRGIRKWQNLKRFT